MLGLWLVQLWLQIQDVRSWLFCPLPMLTVQVVTPCRSAASDWLRWAWHWWWKPWRRRRSGFSWRTFADSSSLGGLRERQREENAFVRTSQYVLSQRLLDKKSDNTVVSAASRLKLEPRDSELGLKLKAAYPNPNNKKNHFCLRALQMHLLYLLKKKKKKVTAPGYNNSKTRIPKHHK